MLQSSTELIPLASIVRLFLVVFVSGLFLLVPLYKFRIKRLVRSELFVKTMFWVPIFGVFLVYIYSANWVRWLVLAWMFAMVGLELWKQHKDSKLSRMLAAYSLWYVAAFGALILIGQLAPAEQYALLVTVAFASVISDVLAFFFGKYIGKHKLPKYLNNHKSWEGVAGQLVGSFVGVFRVEAIVFTGIGLSIFIPIGIGAAAGDLINSYIKRRLGIKDWSKSIPGHGGFADRLSSLSGSIIFGYAWFLVVGL